MAIHSNTTPAPKKVRPRSLDELSFVQQRKGRGEGLRCWSVKPTDDYAVDCHQGGILALEYLAFEESLPDGPGYLPQIVGDMPRKLSGVEIGFLSMVSYAAAAGANRAREISAYWDSCRAAATVKKRKAARS